MRAATIAEYRALAQGHAERAARESDPERKALYRQMEHAYLALIDTQERIHRAFAPISEPTAE